MIYWVQQGEIVELPSEYIEYLFNYYVPDGSLIIPDGVDPVDTSSFRYVIYDCATNPIDVSNKTGYVLSGLYNKPATAQFFPFWAVWMSKPWAPAMPMPNHTFSNYPKKYKVSCLNGTPWEHRKLVYLELSKKDYFDQMVFTFAQRDDYVSTNKLLTDTESIEFTNLVQPVTFVDNDAVVGIDLSINHPAYLETYVNLVTETTVSSHTPMLSEKTFKPIVAGQLFVLVASPGAVQFLRDIGIDTFDDIIDHSYDSVVDIRQRIQLALIQMDRLVEMDLGTLYNQIKPRLKRNSEYFLSQEFRDQFKLNFG
jgi:hypothetical protein